MTADFHDRMTVNQADGIHELDMGIKTQQADKMVGEMQAQKGKDKSRRYLVQPFHARSIR